MSVSHLLPPGDGSTENPVGIRGPVFRPVVLRVGWFFAVGVGVGIE